MPLPEILQSDIIGWTVNHTINDGATATLKLQNTSNKFNAYLDSSLSPITIKAIYNDDEKVVFSGFVTGASEKKDLRKNKTIELSCASYFNRLNKKPLNTELYAPTGTISGDDLLSSIMTEYLSYSDTLFDFSKCTDTFTKIVVSEGSSIDAIKKIAEACLKRVYVKKDGTLYADDYKDEESPVSYIIDRSFIYSMSYSVAEELSYSRLKIRGGYIQNENIPSTVRTVSFESTGATTVEVNVTIPFQSKYSLKNLQQAEITSASLGIDGGYVKTITATDQYNLTIVLQLSGNMLIPGGNVLNITIQPQSNTVDYFSSNLNPIIKPEIRRLLNMFGSKKSYYRSLKSPDEAESGRHEAVVTNTTLVSKIGVLWEELDNPYLQSEAKCLAVGALNFEEFLRNRKNRTIEMVYDSTVNINDKIQYFLLEEDTLATGVVLGIDYTFDAAKPSLTQTLLVSVLDN